MLLTLFSQSPIVTNHEKSAPGINQAQDSRADALGLYEAYIG